MVTAIRRDRRRRVQEAAAGILPALGSMRRPHPSSGQSCKVAGIGATNATHGRMCRLAPIFGHRIGDGNETANDDSSRDRGPVGAGFCDLGFGPAGARARARTSATASPRPVRTTAPPASTPAPVKAPSTTIRSRGNTWPKEPAKRSAARRPRRSPDRRLRDPASSADRGRRILDLLPEMALARVLPAVAGIGLRAPHVAEVRDSRPPIGWLEVHSENYFVDGGPALAALEAMRADYPVSLHGVGLSLGSADPLDVEHLARLKRLASTASNRRRSPSICAGAMSTAAI